MTFYCKNFDPEHNRCNLLRAECVPGRPGCVLAGKVRFSETIEERWRDLGEKPPPRRDSRGRRIAPDPSPGRRRKRG